MYLTSTCQIKTDNSKGDRLILVIDENQCYLRVAKVGVPITHHVEFLNQITHHGENFEVITHHVKISKCAKLIL